MSDPNTQVQRGRADRRRPFADGVGAYVEAGWPSVFPVDPNLKHPDSAIRDRARGVPKGVTGGSARVPSHDDLVGWSQHRGDDCLGVGMTDFGDGTAAIGIDVDSYTKDSVVKDGGSTLARYEDLWGPLPRTWVSTARDPRVSGVHVYRAPAQRYGTHLGSDIEILQSHHRFLLAWPSYNLAADGAEYRWYTPDGQVSDRPPHPDELTGLPLAWEQGLAELATPAGAARSSDIDGMNLLEQLRGDHRPMCADMYRAVVAAGVRVNDVDSGGRHDAFIKAQHRVVHTAASGHTGGGPALAALYELWVEAVGGETRDAEYERGLLGTACKAVTAVAGEQVDVDPCLFDQMGQVLPTVPEPGPGATEVAVARAELPEFSWREGIGTAPFDPQGMTDLALAQESLVRVYPMVRYAYDSGQWLRRGRERWEAYGDLTRRAVAELAGLMPTGDPSPVTAGNQPTPEQLQAQRRKKFYANGASTAIAKTMVAVVTGGLHPCAIRVADLDRDPEILWAGGAAWDLRRCGDGPARVELDPATPHLHSALCAPETRATPAWDHYVATIWPDPEIRAWALRVLSITLTGYADAALPVLYGPERTGKSSIVSLLVKLLGSYGHAADPRLLTGGENAHASIRFDLKGRRLSFIDEGPRSGFAATENLKQLTGGAEMQGNAMRTNMVTWTPSHTLVMTANDAPQITDPALRARMRIIPCEADQAAVKSAREAITAAVWREEAPGVLAAMMVEAAGWLADRRSAGNEAAPGALQAEVDQMAREQNPVGEWVDQCTVPSRPGTQSTELYGKFASWYEGQAKFRYRPLPSATAFGRVLNDLGYPWHKDGPLSNQRYRPLSVLNGGSSTDWFPTGLSRQPEVDGNDQVTGPNDPQRVGQRVSEGSDPKPSEPENPSSSAVSFSSSEGSEGCTPNTTSFYPYYPHMAYTPPVFGGEQGGNPLPSEDDLQNGGPSAKTTGSEGSGETLWDAPSDHDHDNGSVTEADQARSTPVSEADVPGDGSDADQAAPSTDSDEPAPKPKSRAKMTDAERLARREATKAAKAAEREAARLEAVAVASGAVHDLPVAVDRAGAITDLTDDTAAEALAEILSRSTALTVDVETSGYPIGHPDYVLRSVQLGDAESALVLDPLAHAGLVRAALDAASALHAHSATADLVPLAHAGLCDESLWSKMFDTVIPAKLADPASTGSDPGLKKLSAAVLGDGSVAPAADAARAAVFAAGKWLVDIEHDTPVERSGWAQVAAGSEVMLRYAASDVLDAAALTVRLPDVDPAVLERERFAQRASAKLTHRGIRIDAERVARLTAEHTAARDELYAGVREFGVDNPGSTQQVGQKLLSLGATLPQTKTGKPSVTAAVLERLRATEGPWGEFVGQVLDYRHHATLLGLFLEPYGVLCERGDGRARPTIYTIGTNTGRFSSVRPNIQQLPKKGGIRACMTADPGDLMIGADFSGVEIRVAAALSQDPTLLEFLDQGRDLHAEIASQVWGASAGKAERYIAKRAVFGRLYGARVSTIAEQLGITESMAASVVDVLDDITPVLSRWSAAMQSAARSGNTRFTAYSGRVIHLPKESAHAAGNYAIQGTARELLVDALIRWGQTRWHDVVTVPVHDELDAFVPAADAEEATAELVRCMETELFGVKIIADPSAPSPFWADSV